jgi:hypothetical protein
VVARQLGNPQWLAVEGEGDGGRDSRRIAEGRLAPDVEKERGLRAVEAAPQLVGVDALETARRHAQTLAEPTDRRRGGGLARIFRGFAAPPC